MRRETHTDKTPRLHRGRRCQNQRHDVTPLHSPTAAIPTIMQMLAPVAAPLGRTRLSCHYVRAGWPGVEPTDASKSCKGRRNRREKQTAKTQILTCCFTPTQTRQGSPQITFGPEPLVNEHFCPRCTPSPSPAIATKDPRWCH
ncbi:uncharacterized protein LOC117194735 [Drosophila miranda]|uniref:uncharacterized protein LOC117194735 n=1 Tax=Drosophila miranda TaxID=7229 RepID=UPI00143F440F|nr:uncharacterized protein LOC117194735 [Drosophila miranda]